MYQKDPGFGGSLYVIARNEQDLSTKIGRRLRAVRQARKFSLSVVSERTFGACRIHRREQRSQRPFWGFHEDALVVEVLLRFDETEHLQPLVSGLPREDAGFVMARAR